MRNMENNEQKEKQKEHPMDVVRRKALSWDKHHKFGGNQTIWSVLKNEYGDSGAGKLLQLIDFIIEQTAREIIMSEPKEFKEVDGKKALIVPEKKFKVITQLAGYDIGGRKVRDSQGFYVKIDDFKGLIKSSKAEGGLVFIHNIFDYTDLEEQWDKKEETKKNSFPPYAKAEGFHEES